MDVDVFDPTGKPVRGEVGELVCKQPWPGMTRGIWGDPDRYMETYWSMARTSGATATGRDRRGRRLVPARPLRRHDQRRRQAARAGRGRSRSLVAHPAVAESAAVGVPDETKGEAIWCFVVVRAGRRTATTRCAGELRELVAEELGRPFKPSRVVFVDALPKTRSAKILRRASAQSRSARTPATCPAREPRALDAIHDLLGPRAESTE